MRKDIHPEYREVLFHDTSVDTYFLVPSSLETDQTKEWEGLTLVITGTLSSMTRREAESRVKELGGNTTSSVTKNTNFLVAGESAGTKFSTASHLGTPILDESQFISFLENPSADPMANHI